MERTASLSKSQRLIRFLAFVGLAVLLESCATHTPPRHVAVLADTALYETLNDIHGLEQITLCGAPSCAGIMTRVTPTWTDDRSQYFNLKLLPGIAAAREFNAVLGSWDPGRPIPSQLTNLVSSLSTALANVTSSFPDGSTKTQILAAIAKAQQIVLGALNLLLSIQGGD